MPSELALSRRLRFPAAALLPDCSVYTRRFACRPASHPVSGDVLLSSEPAAHSFCIERQVSTCLCYAESFVEEACSIVPNIGGFDATHLFKNCMCCIMKEPDRSDALRSSQVLQIHQKCDSIEAQEVLSQCSECPQILHQLHVQASVDNNPPADRAVAEVQQRMCPRNAGRSSESSWRTWYWCWWTE